MLEACFSLFSPLRGTYHALKYPCLLSSPPRRDFPGGSDDKESACNAEDLSSIPGSGRCLEKGMEIYYRILARRIAWTEEPSGLQPIVSQRAGRY